MIAPIAEVFRPVKLFCWIGGAQYDTIQTMAGFTPTLLKLSPRSRIYKGEVRVACQTGVPKEHRQEVIHRADM
jgi:hypothetical protein